MVYPQAAHGCGPDDRPAHTGGEVTSATIEDYALIGD